MSECFYKNRIVAVAGAALAAAAVAMFVFAGTAHAVTSAEKYAEAQAALQSMNTMQAELDKASDSYDDAKADEKAASKKMQECQKRINAANKEITQVQSKLSSRVSSMYKNGSTSFLDILLGAATFDQFLTSWDMLWSLNKNDAGMVKQAKDLRAEVQAKKAEYKEQKEVASAKAEEAAKIKAKAEETVKILEETYNSLSAEAAALLEQERAAQAAAAAAAAAQEGNGDDGDNGDNGGNAGNAGNNYSGSSKKTSGYSGGSDVVDRAYEWLGKGKYSWGACSPGSFDCSGFVSYAVSGQYERMGSTTTFMSDYQKVSNPKPGDICVNDGHCGIYVGNGKMVHSATYGVGVVESKVQKGMIYVRP